MSVLAMLAKVLMVGHSLIGPDLPPLLDGALSALGQPSSVQAQIINGAPLEWNLAHGPEAEGVDALAVLAEGQVTDLILTEAQPIADHLAFSGTGAQIANYARAARVANPDIRLWLYQTWPAMTPDEDPALWEARVRADLALWQQAMVQAAAAGAGEVGLIPGGQAMAALSQALREGRAPGTTIRDYLADGQHPNGRGRLFLAYLQAGALTGQSPEALPARLTRQWQSRDAVMTEDEADQLQKLAWEVLTTPLPPPPAPSVVELVAENAASTEPSAEPAPPPMAIPPLPPGLTAITNPNLGLGLNGVVDWSTQLPFLDLMKTARPWIGHLPGQWGGWDEAQLRAAGALSPEGWPLRLPAELTGISTIILADLPEDAGGATGRYVASWQGKGAVKVEGRGSVVSASGNQVTFDFTPGEGFVLITLTAIDPADPLRALTVLREDRLALAAKGELFNPDWLLRLQGVKLLRFMDWAATNGSPVSTPADRARPADYTWASPRGVPLEVQIAAANALQADAWFNLPHLANDALAREMAEVVKTGLDPDLLARMEFSNEVWNWQFPQAQWAEATGKARWGQEGTWLQYYGLRAAEVAAIWREVFADAPDRLRSVIATQTGAKGMEQMILDAPLVVAEGLPAPASAFDDYAVTGYFAALLGFEQKLPMVQGWLAESAAADPAQPFGLAFTRAAEELRTGARSGDPSDTLAQLLGEVLPYQAAVAADHGLDLVMYEGGTHVVGIGPVVDDAAITAFFTALNYSPEMGALYDELLAGWALISPAPFMGFVDVARPSKWGAWGALRHLGDDNPRWQALAKGCQC